MATSRTGTSTWKNLRRRVLRKAQANGITNCPNCRVRLDYKQGLQPHSAEVDHVLAHSMGGRDVEDNCTVLCRQCNQSKGNRAAPKAAIRASLKTSRRW